MAKKVKVAVAGQMNGKKAKVAVAGNGMSSARIASPAIQKKIPAPYMEQATVKIKNKQGKVGAPRR